MANHIVVLAAESPLTLAAAVLSVNASLATLITAAAPQPVKVEAANQTSCIAVGPIQVYAMQCTVSYQG